MIDSKELYNLKYYISEYLVPRFIEFKKIFENKSSPTVPTIYQEEIQYYLGYDYEIELNFNEKQKVWIKILDDIIFSFKYQIEEDCSKNPKETIKKIDRGLKLFAKYFKDLWI